MAKYWKVIQPSGHTGQVGKFFVKYFYCSSQLLYRMGYTSMTELLWDLMTFFNIIQITWNG